MTERRLAGLLLLVGFALLMGAAVLYSGKTTPSSVDAMVQSAALSAGLVVTLLGLAAFRVALANRGQRLLAGLGATAYLVGTVLWIIGDVIALAGGPWNLEFERGYTVLACCSIAAIGGAVVRSGVLPVGVGYAAMAWGAAWAAVYLTRIVEAPLGPNLMTGLFGLLLLRHPLGTLNRAP